MTALKWQVDHAEFEASERADRDEAAGRPLEVEMRPLGIALPIAQQTAEFTLRIEKSETVLDEDSAFELMEWLRDRIPRSRA